MTLFTISLYLFVLIGLGIYKSNKIKTQSDFAVAGRSLSPWVLVGTMLATWIGTGSILGNAGKAYETGMAALIIPVGSIFGIILLTQIAAKARSFEKFTVPEIIGDRFGSTARLLCVFALVAAYMVIVSYQYNAGGAVLNTILQDSAGNPLLTEGQGVIIAAIFIIAYTMLAGLVSVAYTDVGNGIVMTISLLIAFPVIWIKAGGMAGMQEAFALTGRSSHMQFFGVYSFLDIINFSLPAFLLVLGDANMYQRFFASKTAKGAKQATITLVFAALIIELLIIAMAWVSSSLIPEAANGRHVLIYTAHQFLPPFLGAIMLTTIVGIIISTADSYLLVPSTTLIKDIYLKHINPQANEKKIVLLSRLVVLVLGLIAYVISIGFSKSASFFERSLYAYTIYGASITPSLVAAFFWKGATKQGAIASILSGMTMTLLWKEAGFMKSLVPASLYNGVDEVLPAIVVSVLCLVGVSLMTNKKKA